MASKSPAVMEDTLAVFNMQKSIVSVRSENQGDYESDQPWHIDAVVESCIVGPSCVDQIPSDRGHSL